MLKRCFLVLVLAGTGLIGAFLPAQPNTNPVKPERDVLDQDELNKPGSTLWVLDFQFKSPRIIKVNVPGRGVHDCLYLWYQVINNTNKPRVFFPKFELHSDDLKMVYADEILPTVEDAIRREEDPENYYKIKNSVTISNEPIPPSMPEATPKAATGVAIFMDPNEVYPHDDARTREEKARMPKLADSNYFSIYIAGLSNGWAVTDPIVEGGPKIVRRKTLQLKFHKVGDRFNRRSEEIKWLPPAHWLYRASELAVPSLPSDR
jgi:hypothetical protein